MKKISLAVTLTLLTPFVAFAQVGQPIQNLVNAFGGIVRSLIPILVALAVVVFFYGLVKYIQASGKGAADGRSIMIAGLISIFVMVSLYGIIYFAQTTLSINTANNTLTPPHVGN